MTFFLAAAAAVLGVVVAIAHSTIGERRIFRPLMLEDQRGALAGPIAQPIMRAVWHLPSLVWATLGIAVLVARLQGGDIFVTVIAAFIFAASGVANLTALRMPHFGGLLLLALAGLVVADCWFAV